MSLKAEIERGLRAETPAISTNFYASNSMTLGEAAGQALALGHLAPPLPDSFAHHRIPLQLMQEQQPMATRLVQVFIADPHESIPVEDRLLYKGEQILTDLTDQELYFDIDIKGILAAHNAKRSKIINKAVKDRTEYLDPARVSQLKMCVGVIATF